MKTKKQYYSIINIPENVDIKKIDNILYFQGPLGKTALHLKKIDPKGVAGILIETTENQLKITTPSKAFYGLLKSIIQNKLQGISRGFLMYLKIVGIGYRANLNSKMSGVSLEKQNIQTLFFKLGYSHDIVYKIPSSIRVFLLDPTLLCLFGVDKNQITQIAAQIRNLRRPLVYKGKGIRLLNEKIVLKVGKRK
jgi:large subunit ribosomal protein L6